MIQFFHVFVCKDCKSSFACEKWMEDATQFLFIDASFPSIGAPHKSFLAVHFPLLLEACRSFLKTVLCNITTIVYYFNRFNCFKYSVSFLKFVNILSLQVIYFTVLLTLKLMLWGGLRNISNTIWYTLWLLSVFFGIFFRLIDKKNTLKIDTDFVCSTQYLHPFCHT